MVLSRDRGKNTLEKWNIALSSVSGGVIEVVDVQSVFFCSGTRCYRNNGEIRGVVDCSPPSFRYFAVDKHANSRLRVV